MSRKKSKTPRRTIPRTQRWKVDHDYLERLSPEERAWLSNFDDAYYNNTHRPEQPWPEEARKDAARNQWRARQDLYSRAREAGDIVAVVTPTRERPDLSRFELSADNIALAAPEHVDTEPTPEYLNSPEYKAALNRFRAALRPDHREAAPKPTSAFKAARNALSKFSPQPKDEDERKN